MAEKLFVTGWHRPPNSSPSAARVEVHLLSDETSKDGVLQGIQADEGTRTLDLLHGKQML
jgi:hypothetical protein